MDDHLPFLHTIPTPDLMSEVLSLKLPNYILKNCSCGSQDIIPKKEIDIYILNEYQARLLYIGTQQQLEAVHLSSKNFDLEPHKFSKADDAEKYKNLVDSANLALRTMWKSIKDDIIERLPWMKGNIRSLQIRSRNRIVLPQSIIPRDVIENDPLSLIPVQLLPIK